MAKGASPLARNRGNSVPIRPWSEGAPVLPFSFYWVGKRSSGRVLTTRFTRRGTKIRIIGSAEWREFRRLYSEKAKQP